MLGYQIVVLWLADGCYLPQRRLSAFCGNEGLGASASCLYEYL